MADTFSVKERSEIMRAVKSKRNKSTELKLIKIFKENQIKGWRRNYKLIGKPDFVFPKSKVIVFVDGCFWHGHGCRNINPSTNEEYWEKKINRNMERDKIVTENLIKKGWKVLRFWECELLKKRFVKKVELLKDFLKQ